MKVVDLLSKPSSARIELWDDEDCRPLFLRSDLSDCHTVVLTTTQELAFKAGDEVLVELSAGDWEEDAGTHRATVIQVDEPDDSLPYRVEFKNMRHPFGPPRKMWVGPDEVKPLPPFAPGDKVRITDIATMAPRYSVGDIATVKDANEYTVKLEMWSDGGLQWIRPEQVERIDPEFERLLAEEEDIERRASEHDFRPGDIVRVLRGTFSGRTGEVVEPSTDPLDDQPRVHVKVKGVSSFPFQYVPESIELVSRAEPEDDEPEPEPHRYNVGDKVVIVSRPTYGRDGEPVEGTENLPGKLGTVMRPSGRLTTRVHVDGEFHDWVYWPEQIRPATERDIEDTELVELRASLDALKRQVAEALETIADYVRRGRR